MKTCALDKSCIGDQFLPTLTRHLGCLMHNLLSVATTALQEQIGYQSRPTCLVTGSDTGSIIPVEIFIEPDEVTPMRVSLKFLNPTKDRSTPCLITQKDTGQAARKLPRHLFQRQHIA